MGCPYDAVGMQRASDSAIGLPRRSTSASWMLVFLMPAEVRRNLMLPPGVITAGENGPEPRQPSLIQGHSRTLTHTGDPSRVARIPFVPEAQLEDFGSGLTPVTQGWFVVNVRDAEWWFSERRGARCAFENEYGEPPVEFAQFGINVTSWSPGRPASTTPSRTRRRSSSCQGSARCSWRTRSEACGPGTSSTLPPWTEHAFVGAGEGPCVILMVGSRSGPEVHYPVSELAARYGASVAEETSDWREAYATVERFRRERPPNWARLPWA
jgi:hypothetical protein